MTYQPKVIRCRLHTGAPMELEYGITTEQANAAAQVLRAAGIKTEKLAETLWRAAEVVAGVFEVLAEAFNILADAWEKIKESGVLEITPESRARRRAQERARAKIIEQRYRAEIRRVENTRIYRRIYKPP